MCCGKNRQQLQMQMQSALRKGVPPPPGSNPVPVPPTAPLPASGLYRRPPQFFVGARPNVGPHGHPRFSLVPRQGFSAGGAS
jgi:hypothetical protein